MWYYGRTFREVAKSHVDDVFSEIINFLETVIIRELEDGEYNREEIIEDLKRFIERI